MTRNALPHLRQRLGAWWDRVYKRHTGKVLVTVSSVLTLLLVWAYGWTQPTPQHLTQPQLTAAVNFAIDKRPRPPSVASLAYASVINSVVRVNGYDPSVKQPEKKDSKEVEAPKAEGPDPDFHEDFVAVGTGVVIDDIACPAARTCYTAGTKGTILRAATGTKFAPVKAPAREDLDGIACVTASACYAVGAAGTIEALRAG